MTEFEKAFNLGIDAALVTIRGVSAGIPATHTIGPKELLGLADGIEGLKYADPIPDARGCVPNSVCEAKP